MQSIRQTVSDRFNDLGFGVRELARRADVSPTTISDYMSGKKDVTSERLDRIFDALQLEVKPSQGRPPKGTKG